MFRGSLAGVMLALSASTALAAPIVADGTQDYVYVTSISTPQAPGTTTAPPSGGIKISGVSVGGLCQPTGTNCPAIGNTFGFLQGPLVSAPSSTSLVIPIVVPLTPATNFRLTFQIADDTLATFTGGPPPSTGDIFEVTVNGQSLGTTSVVGLGGQNSPASSGAFSTIVKGGTTVNIGITDLLQPYANGAVDTLPGVLGKPALNGGTVLASAYNANIVDLLEPNLVAAPEPNSFALFGAGLAFVGILRGRRGTR